MRGSIVRSAFFVSGTNMEFSSLTPESSSSSVSSTSYCSTSPSLMACATPTPLITATSDLRYRFSSTKRNEKTCLFGVEDSAQNEENGF